MKYTIIQDFALRSDRRMEEQTIPLYDLSAIAGITSMFVGNESSVDEIRVPGLPPCDGAIHVEGDSMEPLFAEGDVALYKMVPNRRGGLFFGHIYLLAFSIDGEDYNVIKYVRQSDIPGHYRLESRNPAHPPRDIPVSAVRAMAIVKGVVRLCDIE